MLAVFAEAELTVNPAGVFEAQNLVVAVPFMKMNLELIMSR